MGLVCKLCIVRDREMYDRLIDMWEDRQDVIYLLPYLSTDFHTSCVHLPQYAGGGPRRGVQGGVG